MGAVLRDRGPLSTSKSTASPPVNSTLARVVSKWVLFGTTLAGSTDRSEENLFGGPSLVRWDDVPEREEVLDGLKKPKPGWGSRIALVAVLNRRPLVA